MIIKLLKCQFLPKQFRKRTNISQVGAFQYCYFGTLNPQAFKLLVEILLSEIF